MLMVLKEEGGFFFGLDYKLYEFSGFYNSHFDFVAAKSDWMSKPLISSTFVGSKAGSSVIKRAHDHFVKNARGPQLEQNDYPDYLNQTCFRINEDIQSLALASGSLTLGLYKSKSSIKGRYIILDKEYVEDNKECSNQNWDCTLTFGQERVSAPIRGKLSKVEIDGATE